jgi:hypothetical protein
VFSYFPTLSHVIAISILAICDDARRHKESSMPEMSSGAALRQLQQAQAGLRKARQALQHAKGDPQAAGPVLKAGWESLCQAHRLLAAIPLVAANEPVMTKQLAVERYATALLVRLRRLLRNEPIADTDADDLEDQADDL